MSDQKTFAFIYNNPEPHQVVLWPNWYEKDKEYLDTHYNIITEYNITNLGWSAWLSNNQPYIVLSKKDIVPQDVVETKRQKYQGGSDKDVTVTQNPTTTKSKKK